MWDLACKYYTPHLRNKSLTKKVGPAAGVHCYLPALAPRLLHGCVLMRVRLSSAPCTPCCFFGAPIHALLLSCNYLQIHVEVQAAFVERFGPFAGEQGRRGAPELQLTTRNSSCVCSCCPIKLTTAPCCATAAGWAHNTLFISELSSTQAKVAGLAAVGGGRSGSKRKAKGSSSSASEAISEDYSEAAASEPSSSDGGAALPDTPSGADEAAAASSRPVRRARRRAATVSAADV